MTVIHERYISGLARLPAVQRLIALAIDEDLGRGDVTTSSVILDQSSESTGEVRARASLVVFGLDVMSAVFHAVDRDIQTHRMAEEGEPVAAGRAVMRVTGPTYAILQAERTALNFVQRLSGVATLSRRYADAVVGTSARVVDTRKTTPGYRVLQKAAVVAGGCYNHRFDLGGGVLIKDNHIAACGSIAGAIANARARAPHSLRIEVEVDTRAQLDQALAAGADVVLLDNMTPDQVQAAAALAHEHKIIVEVSGGITLKTVRAYAEAGADIISVGALTHSAPAVDFGLDMEASDADDADRAW